MDILNLTTPSPLITSTVDLNVNKLWTGGEINIRTSITSPGKEGTIYTRLNNSEDVMRLFMASELFEKTHVVFPYLPYARQDRACHTGEPFSLKVLASLFNSRKFKSIKALDVHSNASEMLFKNLTNASNYWFVEHALYRMNVDYDNICLVSPDAGALKKIKHLAEELGGIKTLPCFKHRSVSNGSIESVFIPEDKLDPNLHYVVVDDICDGGRTFITLAEALREKGATDIRVVVTHGIFSYGIDPLFNSGITQVWTTTSISDVNRWADNPNYHQLDVWEYMK